MSWTHKETQGYGMKGKLTLRHQALWGDFSSRRVHWDSSHAPTRTPILPSRQGWGHGAPDPPSAALGSPGPDPDLCRLPLLEVFPHRHVPARPRGAPASSPWAKWTTRSSCGWTATPRVLGWSRGSRGWSRRGRNIGRRQGPPRPTHSLPNEPADPERLLEPERGLARVSHHLEDAWLRQGVRRAPPPGVSPARLRRQGLHRPEPGPVILDRRRHGGSDHPAQVGSCRRGGGSSSQGGCQPHRVMDRSPQTQLSTSLDETL
uniref:uncharacterized protein LOC720162 n=1 Tax=Macaca mulatta TaxID=9544 RepID=UPI0010A22454|nr:uncharacterized protein LOC720162 [Macaca mulatta]